MFSSSRWQRFCANPIIQFLGILVLCLPLASLRNKTPNLGWMGVHTDPSVLDNPLFPFEVTIPIFRPWLWVEAANYHFNQSLWLAEVGGYALFTTLALFMLLRTAIKTKQMQLFSWLIIPLGLMIFAAAGGGIIYDVVALSATIAIALLTQQDTITQRTTHIFALGLAFALLDLARPYGLYLITLIVLLQLIQKRFTILLSLAIATLLVAPFHYAQYQHTGQITLSCYSGCNLAEVFPAPRDCVAELGRPALDTPEGAACCLENANAIKQNLRDNPLLLLTAFKPQIMLNLAAPHLYWHGWGTDKYLKPLQIPFSLMMIAVWMFALRRLYDHRKCGLNILCPPIILGSFALIILFSHNGTEMVRVALPFHGMLTAYIMTLKSNAGQPTL